MVDSVSIHRKPRVNSARLFFEAISVAFSQSTSKQGALPLLCLIFGIAIAGCKPEYPGPKPQLDVQIRSASLSPSGDRVAFSYEDKRSEKSRKGIALYHINSDRVEFLKLPEYLRVGAPSFSPDGKRLLVTAFCYLTCSKSEFGYHIGLFDLETGKYTQLTENGGSEIRLSPEFSPDGQTIYFSWAKAEWNKEGGSRPAGFFGIASVKLDDPQETILLPNTITPSTFQLVGKMTPTANGDLIFTCKAPSRGPAQAAMEAAGKSLVYPFPCSLKPDGELDYFLPLTKLGYSQLSASADGKKVFFTSRADSTKGQRGYVYDLYLFEGAQTSRLTTLETYTSETDASADGSIVLLRADEDRGHNWSIWLHDMETGNTREIVPPERLLELLPQTDMPVKAKPTNS